jgi:hypothetical protein
MIRRQARFLGKSVRALATPNTGAILRKNPETAEISQANAWNELAKQC